MLQIETKIIIMFRWWRGDTEQHVIEEHINQLDREALDRVTSMAEEGYGSGGLIANIDDIDYQGWWEVTTERE